MKNILLSSALILSLSSQVMASETEVLKTIDSIKCMDGEAKQDLVASQLQLTDGAISLSLLNSLIKDEAGDLKSGAGLIESADKLFYIIPVHVKKEITNEDGSSAVVDIENALCDSEIDTSLIVAVKK